MFDRSLSCDLSREQINEKRGGRQVSWGCLCRGNSAKGGAELECRRCKLTFHEKCERLDYSPAEMDKMQENGSFICAECEQVLPPPTFTNAPYPALLPI